MKLILKCYPENSEFDKAQYGLVDLDESFSRLILHRRSVRATLLEAEKNLDVLHYWCLNLQVFSEWPQGKLDELERLQNQVDSEGYAVVPRGMLPIDKIEFERTEGDRMIVEQDGVRWYFHPKHCDFGAESSQLAWAIVENPNNDISACQDCGYAWMDFDLKEIQDIHQRVAPGESMPSGECPKCGALCQVVKV